MYLQLLHSFSPRFSGFVQGKLFQPPKQLPFFIILGVIEVLVFGAGVAFLVIAWPLVNKARKEMRTRAIAMYISTAWLLVSWWPHDNFRQSIGDNMGALLAVEYGFHFTLMVAGLVIAYCLYTIWSGE